MVGLSRSKIGITNILIDVQTYDTHPFVISDILKSNHDGDKAWINAQQVIRGRTTLGILKETPELQRDTSGQKIDIPGRGTEASGPGEGGCLG